MAELTKDEAEAMLKQLSAHFKEPVMPVSRYCHALKTWQRALYERASRLMESLYPVVHSSERTPDGRATPETEAALALYRAERDVTDRIAAAHRAGQEPTDRDYALEDLRSHERLSETVGQVFLQIQKSNLLWRLIYGGQELRTTPCPEHKGKWSGCMWPKDEKDVCACMDGCNVTGWLPDPPPPEFVEETP